MIRRITALLLALALLTACEEKIIYIDAELACDRTDAILSAETGATAQFVVTASGKWSLAAQGAGYTVAPTQGDRGETAVTITAEGPNDGARLRELGGIAVRLAVDGQERHIDVFQRPELPSKQTLLMYFPWSGNLTSYFETNIQDMEKALAQGILQEERVLVLFMDTATTASLFELCAEDGGTHRATHKRYDPIHDFTTAEGIATILEEVRRQAPAERYALTVSCHGMSWIPASRGQAARGARHEKGHWEYDGSDRPLTRWFGGSAYQTDIEDLAAAIARTGMKMEYILFDDCYMASAEVAYALRHAAGRLIASPTEIMGYGFPYAEIGRYMIGEVDYAGISQGYYDFYSAYTFNGRLYPYGTISVTECSQLEALAEVMRRINEKHTFEASPENLAALQRMDGYTPTCFFDLGDYVRQLCDDPALLDEFEAQLERTVPSVWRRNTERYYSYKNGANPIRTYSGMTVSDPSIHTDTQRKTETAWWQATH